MSPASDKHNKGSSESGKESYEIQEIEAIPIEVANPESHKLEDVTKIPSPPQLSPNQRKRLYRKIDLRLLPILILIQVCSYLDRGNIANAKLQGLTAQLNLTGNRYNDALALYFVPYILLECPSSLATKKLRPSRWLPGLTIAWGIAMTLMGLITTYPQLIGVRMTLGALEAGLFPGVTWYLSMWYPKHEFYFRMALFWGGATIAGAFSGVLAFAISFMSGTAGKLGWSWIFIIEGLLTIVVGFVALFVLVDFPESAKFLTAEEREYVIWRNKYENSAAGEIESFQIRHIRAALSDWQVWTHALMFMSLVGPLFGISYFLPSIINGFGFTPAISQLLTVPPYVFASVLGLIAAILSDRLKIRFPFVLAGHAMCILGFGIQLSNAPHGVKYFGTFFCVAGGYGMFPALPSWIANNTAGQYKRGAAIAINVALGNTAGSIAFALFRPQDAPRYVIGNSIELMFISIGIIALTVEVCVYKRINANRDRRVKELEEKGIVFTAEQLRDMGDKAPDFRYTL